MTDPRPGFDEVGRSSQRIRLPRGEAVFGLLLGLVVSAVLIGVMPDVRHHMFGGTDLRRTTVLEAESKTRPGGNDREVAHYRLSWRDDEGRSHTPSFQRSGPVRHEVGDTWRLWVSAKRPGATTDTSPWQTWLWLGVAIPLFSLIIGWLVQWRQRVMVRSTLRGIERREARRQRRESSQT